MTHRHIPTVDEAIKEYDAAERALEEASTRLLEHQRKQELHDEQTRRLDGQRSSARRRLDIANAVLVAAARARR